MVNAEAVDRSRINSSRREGISQIADQTFVLGNGVMQAGVGRDGNDVSSNRLSGCDNVDNEPQNRRAPHCVRKREN